MGLRSPYPLFHVASVRRQEAALRFSYGFTGSTASKMLFSGKLHKFENRNHKSVARRYVVGGMHGHSTISAQPLHSHRTISVQPLHGHHTGSVRFPCRGYETARQLHDFHTISAQPLYRFTWACLRGPRTRNGTMLVDNVG